MVSWSKEGRVAEHARLENAFQGHHLHIAEVLSCNPGVWHLQAMLSPKNIENMVIRPAQPDAKNGTKIACKPDVFQICQRFFSNYLACTDLLADLAFKILLLYSLCFPRHTKDTTAKS